MPLTTPRLLPSEEEWLPERWREMTIEMMAAPLGGQAAVVLGRSGGPAFRRSELLRLAHLTGIAGPVAHLPPDRACAGAPTAVARRATRGSDQHRNRPRDRAAASDATGRSPRRGPSTHV